MSTPTDEMCTVIHVDFDNDTPFEHMEKILFFVSDKDWLIVRVRAESVDRYDELVRWYVTAGVDAPGGITFPPNVYLAARA